jgi:hypothetical protein
MFEMRILLLIVPLLLQHVGKLLAGRACICAGEQTLTHYSTWPETSALKTSFFEDFFILAMTLP